MPRAGDKVRPAPRLLSGGERGHINACGGPSPRARDAVPAAW